MPQSTRGLGSVGDTRPHEVDNPIMHEPGRHDPVRDSYAWRFLWPFDEPDDGLMRKAGKAIFRYLRKIGG